MRFPETYGECFADVYELEYVETEAGDVWAYAIVGADGTIYSVIDDDGHELTAWPIEECRALWERRELRRAEAA